jgi:hypothetical protein
MPTTSTRDPDRTRLVAALLERLAATDPATGSAA